MSEGHKQLQNTPAVLLLSAQLHLWPHSPEPCTSPGREEGGREGRVTQSRHKGDSPGNREGGSKAAARERNTYAQQNRATMTEKVCAIFRGAIVKFFVVNYTRNCQYFSEASFTAEKPKSSSENGQNRDVARLLVLLTQHDMLEKISEKSV